MKCPRCRKKLFKKTIINNDIEVEVNMCIFCDGIWFDFGELSRLDEIITLVLIEFRQIPNRKDQLKTLSCPTCGDATLLEKAEHPRDKHVIVDFCTNCKGVWLDHGELEAIQQDDYLKITSKALSWLLGGE